MTMTMLKRKGKPNCNGTGILKEGRSCLNGSAADHDGVAVDLGSDWLTVNVVIIDITVG